MAIPAVELYLSALLLAAGRPSIDLRRMHHDMESRTEMAIQTKLALRKRTLAHLMALSERREYLRTRYDPVTSETSNLNRLAATLAKVAEKVNAAIGNP